MKIPATVDQIRALLRLAEARGDESGVALKALPRSMPRGLVERYEALLAAGRTPVIVPIERGGCSGCHLRLPTMVEHLILHLPAVHFCPHCRRMLYAPELIREGRGPADGDTPPPMPPAARRS